MVGNANIGGKKGAVVIRKGRAILLSSSKERKGLEIFGSYYKVD